VIGQGAIRQVVVWVWVLVFTCLSPGLAQTADDFIDSKHVMIRQRLDPAEPVYVGQPVRVWVEVMTRTWFLQAPQFPPTIEVRHAVVIPPDAFGVNSTERIGRDTYAVQSRAYTIFPQTQGRFEIPRIAVRLVVAQDDASRSPEITLRTEPVMIESRLPTGAEGHGLVLSTPSLSVQESYDRSVEGMKVGDSLRRQVTMTIQDSVAMLLPPIPFEVDKGIAVYPGRPEVDDQRNRGQLRGTRVDQATYVMEAEGAYQLPETSIWWWNLRTSTLEEEVLPSLTLTVEANPDLAAEHLGQTEEEGELAEDPIATEDPGWGFKEWALALGALALGFLVLRKIWEGFGSGREREARKEESEEVFFHRFEAAARSDDPVSTYEALLRWLDRFEPVDSPASVRGFVNLANDEKLTRECDTLEGMLYGGKNQSDGKAWSGQPLAAAVGRARKKLRAPKHALHAPLESLPPLNP